MVEEGRGEVVDSHNALRGRYYVMDTMLICGKRMMPMMILVAIARIRPAYASVDSVSPRQDEFQFLSGALSWIQRVML